MAEAAASGELVTSGSSAVEKRQAQAAPGQDKGKRLKLSDEPLEGLSQQDAAPRVVEEDAQAAAEVVDAGHNEDGEDGGVYSDLDEGEVESDEYSDYGSSDDDSLVESDEEDAGGVSSPPRDRKGKGIVLRDGNKGKDKAAVDVKGKGKAVLVEEDDSSGESEEVVEDELGNLGDEEEDPLLEVDLNNILPSRTRRTRPQQPLQCDLRDDSSEDEDEDYVAGGKAD